MARRARKDGGEGKPKTPEGSETVLVVSSDPSVRKVVARVLEHYGYRALVARDLRGAEHVSEKHDGTIHAVLVQVESPEEPCPHDSDGFLRSHPEMKLLCMSGYPREVVCRVKPCRSSGFIPMPFKIGELARAVREALHGSRTVRDSPNGV